MPEGEPAADAIAGVILAGGRARRMGGGDKALCKLGGRPLIAHVLQRIAPQVVRLVINAGGEPARFARFGLPVAADSVPGHAGPLAGILCGLEWAAANAPGATHVLSVPTDAPFLPRDLVPRLATALAGADIAMAASGGRTHPVVGLWPIRLAGSLRRAVAEEGLRKVDAWTARYRVRLVSFAVTPRDPFFNINRPEDIARAALDGDASPRQE